MVKDTIPQLNEPNLYLLGMLLNLMGYDKAEHPESPADGDYCA